MNISYIVNPYITSGVVALVASIGLAWLLVVSRATFAKVLGRLFTRAGFFWLVNLVFMAISAYHAAPFFGNVVSTIPGLEGIAQYIGLPVALVIDGVTIVFMQARMEASYKRDDRKRDMYTRYVFASALLNTVANLYTDIQHFQYGNYNGVGVLIYAAPVILSVFPMFLVAISKAADEMVNVKSFEKMDVEEFERQEKRRVEILEKQADYLDRETKAIERLIQIEAAQKQNEILRHGKLPKSFRWPWEKAIDIADITTQLQAVYEPQIEQLHRQLQQAKADSDNASQIALRAAREGAMMSTEVEQLRATYEAQIEALSEQMEEVKERQFFADSGDTSLTIEEADIPEASQPESDISTGHQPADDSGQISVQPTTRKRTKVSSAETEKRRKAERILRQNPAISAAKLGEKIGCSRSHAGQLKREILEQRQERDAGELPASQSEQNTDPLPATNGHKNTRPLGEYVPLEI